MKTLYRKYTPATYSQIQSDIEKINEILGFPDNTGTVTYAQIPDETIITDSEGNVIEAFKLLVCTHELQQALIEKGGLDLPMVSVEVLNGQWVSTDSTVEGDTLEGLPDNVKNCEIIVPKEALYEADQETIETLLGDGNIL